MEVNVLIDEVLGECLEENWLERVAEKVLTAQGADPSTDLGLVIVGQERIRQLNFSYLGKDAPTDVLAFSLLTEQTGGDLVSFVSPPNGIKYLGEVIISYHQAIIQATEHKHSVKREIAILIIHGVLHILGYEHDTPEQERDMRARETEILNYIEGELK